MEATLDQQPSYWLRIIDAAGRSKGLRPMHQLYRHRCLDVVARTRLRAIQALLTHLGHVAARQRDDLIDVDVLALVGHGRAVLVPSAVRRRLQRIERRLWDAGITAVDAPGALLDTDDAAVVVPTPLEPVDETAMSKLKGAADHGRPEPATKPGSYPVAGWVLQARQPPQSRAEAAVRATGLLEGRDAAAALPTVAKVLRNARVAPMPQIRDLPAVVADLVTSGRTAAASPTGRTASPSAGREHP